MMVGTVTAEGVSMRYCVFGEGKIPMVIIPGLSVKYVTEVAVGLPRQYGAFTKTHTVYLFDRREDPPSGYTLRGMAEDTRGAMRELGIESADVFAVSQGGLIAQILAAQYPQAVRHLALASTVSTVTDTAQTVLDRWSRLAEERDTEALARDFAEYIYSEETRRKYGDALKRALDGVTEKEFDRFAVFANALCGVSQDGILSRIKCPTLVLGAYGDRIFPPEEQQKIADGIGCPSYFFPDRFGHAVYDEAPELLERVREFFGEA